MKGVRVTLSIHHLEGCPRENDAFLEIPSDKNKEQEVRNEGRPWENVAEKMNCGLLLSAAMKPETGMKL